MKITQAQLEAATKVAYEYKYPRTGAKKWTPDKLDNKQDAAHILKAMAAGLRVLGITVSRK